MDKRKILIISVIVIIILGVILVVLTRKKENINNQDENRVNSSKNVSNNIDIEKLPPGFSMEKEEVKDE